MLYKVVLTFSVTFHLDALAFLKGVYHFIGSVEPIFWIFAQSLSQSNFYSGQLTCRLPHITILEMGLSVLLSFPEC